MIHADGLFVRPGISWLDAHKRAELMVSPQWMKRLQNTLVGPNMLVSSRSYGASEYIISDSLQIPSIGTQAVAALLSRFWLCLLCRGDGRWIQAVNLCVWVCVCVGACQATQLVCKFHEQKRGEGDAAHGVPLQ